jgi:hypothetical protein
MSGNTSPVTALQNSQTLKDVRFSQSRNQLFARLLSLRPRGQMDYFPTAIGEATSFQMRTDGHWRQQRMTTGNFFRNIAKSTTRACGGSTLQLVRVIRTINREFLLMAAACWKDQR